MSPENYETISETLAMSDDSTEVIIPSLHASVFLERNLTARNYRKEQRNRTEVHSAFYAH